MKSKNKSSLTILSSIHSPTSSPLPSLDILTFTKQPTTNTYNLQTSSTTNNPETPPHTQTPQQLSPTTPTTTINIPPTPFPTMPFPPTTQTPSSAPCTHSPLHALTCPTCIFAHNTARERLIRAYYDPIIADLELRIAIAVERLWIGDENEFLKERLVGAQEDLEGLKARREGEVGGVWGR